MALDANWIDTYLKDEPLRDLAFRGLVWTGLSVLANYFAIRRGIAPLDYLQRLTDSIGPMIKAVAPPVVFFGFCALWLKDLEHARPEKFGQERLNGRLGSVVRRVSGDLLLWTLAACTGFFSATVVAISETPIKPSEWAAVANLVYLLVMVIAFIVVITHWVRRSGPSPFANHVSSMPKVLSTIYFATLAAPLLYAMWRR